MTVHIYDDNFTPLPIYFATASAHYDQKKVVRPAGLLEMSQILFVLDGHGTLTTEGKEYQLKKGCAFYMDYNTPHSYENISELTTAWITWRGDGSENIRQYIGALPFVFFDSVDVKKYADEIKKLENEYYSKKREGVLSYMTYSIIMSFFDEIRKTELSAMDKVLLYMEEHFNEQISVEQLASISFRSVSSFCKDFKNAFGCTAFEKLIDIRLLNAREMLLDSPDESVKSIASRCSFNDLSYFCKAYKKKFARTPTEDRKLV